jgi:hypothetical protein
VCVCVWWSTIHKVRLNEIKERSLMVREMVGTPLRVSGIVEWMVNWKGGGGHHLGCQSRRTCCHFSSHSAQCQLLVSVLATLLLS